MKHIFPLAFSMCSALLLASAQESSPVAIPSSIAGTVVKEPGSQPLKKALVQVVAENQKEGGNYSASTDANGHFRIENIVPGRYHVFIERTGFVGVNSRGVKSDTHVVTIQRGQPVDDLVFRMLPTAVIGGRITDEDGDPIRGVSVFALRKVPGKAAREAAGTEATNDLGDYRLAGLFPGQYWVVAMPPPDSRDYEQAREKQPPEDRQSDTNSETRYLTTYYPGTYDGAQASAVMLKAGDEMPVNFVLLPARTYRVRGVVTGIPSGLKPVVELVPKTGDSIHANEVGPDGQFQVRGVGPGSYVLRVSAGNGLRTLTARQEVNVVAADVEGVKLVPQSSFTISGHLHFENGGWGDPTHYVVNLRAIDLPDEPSFFISQEFFGMNAPVDRLGSFEWKDVSAGKYTLQLYGGDGQSSFFLKSVRLGGRDVETGFTASGPVTIDAVVSTRGGALEGTVVEEENDKGNNSTNSDQMNNDRTNAEPATNRHPVPNGTVVAVPEEKFRKLPDHFGTAFTDQQGRFMIRGLAPGSYTLYAWQDLEESVYRDTDFLRSQEANGTAVKVEEGSRQTVELNLSAVAEEWR